MSRVSIARRRFVVLRLMDETSTTNGVIGFQSPAGDSLSCDTYDLVTGEIAHTSFNRPQAIRCLATMESGPDAKIGHTVSIARRRFVVLRPIISLKVGETTVRVSIARRRFVVLRPSHRAGGQSAAGRFNRPQAIRCLATMITGLPSFTARFVSIARRRFVVLRPTVSSPTAKRSPAFQSPAGDSLSCDLLVHGPADVLVKSFNRPQAIRCLAT